MYIAPSGAPAQKHADAQALQQAQCNQPKDCAAIPRLTCLVNALEERCIAFAHLHERLQKAMNFVEGCPPPPPSGPAIPNVPPDDGALGALERRVSSLFAIIEDLDNEVRRLERIVG